MDGDHKILEHAVAHGFILISTDSEFEALSVQFPTAKIVILRSCGYPTAIAADLLRRKAIRIAELSHSADHLIFLDR